MYWQFLVLAALVAVVAADSAYPAYHKPAYSAPAYQHKAYDYVRCSSFTFLQLQHYMNSTDV